MSAKVEDTLNSNELTETRTPPRSKKSKSKKLTNSNGKSSYTTRQRSRNYNSNPKPESPPKTLKLFPIFNTRKIVEKNSPISIIDVTVEDTEISCVNNRQNGDITQLDKKEKSSKNLPDKVTESKRKKRIAKKNNLSLTSKSNGDQLANHDHDDTQVQSDELKVEETATFCDTKNVDSEIRDVIDYLCVKIESIINNGEAKVSTQVSLTPSSNLNNSKLSCNKSSKSNKKKSKSKSVENEVLVNIAETEDISDRRKSLRSRGVKNKFINYSEIDSDAAQVKKLKSDKTMKLVENTDCVLVDTDIVQENLIASCKVKENTIAKDKLFPIFTCNKVNGTEKIATTRTKRKASSEENENSNRAERKKVQSSKKKIKSDTADDKSDSLIKISLKEKVHLVCDAEKLDEKGNDLSIFTESKLVVKSSENSQKRNNSKFSSIQSSDCEELTKSVKTNSVSNLSDDGKINILEEKNIKIISHKKLNQPCNQDVPFPVLSHSNTCCESLSDIENKFSIHELSDLDVVVPNWDRVVGLTDVHCFQSISNKKDCINSEKNSVNVSSDVKENDREENTLWTDTLQSTVSKEKNNACTVSEIKSWLLQWKNKFSKNSETKSYDSDSDSFSAGSDSDDDSASNSIIITGPPGCGKTSLVFSLADELGFKVIEVNASSSRHGKNISSELKEALESYHVESIKIDNPFEQCMVEVKKRKPETNNENLKTKGIKDFFQKKGNVPKEACSDKKKKDIAGFFKKKNCEEKPINSKSETRNKKQPDKRSVKKNEKDISKVDETVRSDNNKCKISSLTIILFDDVDIVFEEDEGFWGTVKGFLKISKKPVIFTVSRNLSIVKAMLNSDMKVFSLKSTSKTSAVQKIQTHCKTHSREKSTLDLELLVSQNMNDFRRNILNAQFWTKTSKSFINEKLKDVDDYLINTVKDVQSATFSVGELDFSSDHLKKLLHSHTPHFFSNAISQFQSLGYDILHCNLFYLLNILDLMKCEKLWQTESVKKSSDGRNFSDAQMWEEACEIFKLKKLALQKGSSSQELIAFADALEDFSFADTLRGPSRSKFHWMSMSERIRMWTDGLPICDDNSIQSCDDILCIISLIHIYILRKIQSMDCIKSNFAENNRLILEHPFVQYDEEFAYKTENDVSYLSSVLPYSQQLSKTALILDYLSMIKLMCQDEENRQLNSGKRSGRFLHYFDSISFLYEKRTF